ncbi:GNAT family N-acetyltransferase [Deinococcus radiophilus]|nr:GNAT family N-acetyltransferase [Deinococcus radiophilus]UFA50746.1 GNAT family N-acetyltransferase [Deinococcus radiophilus]
MTPSDSVSAADLTLRRVTDPAELQAAAPALAQLRMTVFRDYPYLYHGSERYERDYLARYLRAPDMLLLLVEDAGQVVGASTALPLWHEQAALVDPFEAAGIDVSEWLYLGESVLLPPNRGRGFGHRCFDEREAHARALGLSNTAFCAVQRPADHPSRPVNYRSLTSFWEGRGYREQPDLDTVMSWQDLGEETETAKPMRFWTRQLTGR